MRAVVIGAGPAGLAVGACLKDRGVGVTLLERGDRPGEAWHHHYDRLHLHTPRWRSNLPLRPMPANWPRYPSRRQVTEYLADYAAGFDLAPRFRIEVTSVARTMAGGWRVDHSGGEEEADIVVFATGMAGRPHRPDWPGLDGFPGETIHSSDYRNPAGFVGRRVLVVGFGNSGGEIALDLAEAGVAIEIAVRSPVNLLPKELFGIPILAFGLLQKIFHYRTADAITAPILRLKLGDYSRYGLRKSPKGPVAQVIEDGRIPLIDIGTLEAIRAGRIAVRPGIDRFEGAEAVFEDGARAAFDALILATGYHPDLRSILGEARDLLDATGRPRVCGAPTARPGLYFCSYHPSARGQLAQIGIEARAIAEAVAGTAAPVRAA